MRTAVHLLLVACYFSNHDAIASVLLHDVLPSVRPSVTSRWSIKTTLQCTQCHPQNGDVTQTPHNCTNSARSSSQNKAVIGRRLRPRCCHLGSYFKRPKSSSVRPLACNWYYCAQFIAKLKAACALRFSWAATSSNDEKPRNRETAATQKHSNASININKTKATIKSIVGK